MVSRHYFEFDYDSKQRFCSYWHQINEILSLRPRGVLEVGIGNGFVSNYLKNKGIQLVSLDVDTGLNPDVNGSVLATPFQDNAFDVVFCCQVLEHLPYSYFGKALQELHRVSTKRVVLSLPDVTTVYRVNVELPRINPIKRLIPHPFPRPPRRVFDDEHYWEIGMVGYPLKKIQVTLRESGLKVINTYRVFEFIYHRFFVLEKINHRPSR